MAIVCHRHFEEGFPKVKCTHLDRMQLAAGWKCATCARADRILMDVRSARQRYCPDCQEAQQNWIEREQREDTIDPEQPWGEHIMLTCKNHPNLRWHTKNISYIGARSIFFSGGYIDVVDDTTPRTDDIKFKRVWASAMSGLHECKCGIGSLEVLK
jgi:hypothetical protein